MQLSRLLGVAVLDADEQKVGTVIDVRLLVEDEADREPTVVGFVVSPHTSSSYLGYERTGVNSPRLLAAIARWRHRGTFLAAWADISRVGADHVALRRGYQRRSAMLGDAV